jgi:hypothetical protein
LCDDRAWRGKNQTCWREPHAASLAKAIAREFGAGNITTSPGPIDTLRDRLQCVHCTPKEVMAGVPH